MKMRGRKATAFIIGIAVLLIFFGGILWKNAEALAPAVIICFISALILIIGLFIGGNTLDKIARFKFPLYPNERGQDE